MPTPLREHKMPGLDEVEPLEVACLMGDMKRLRGDVVIPIKEGPPDPYHLLHPDKGEEGLEGGEGERGEVVVLGAAVVLVFGEEQEQRLQAARVPDVHREP